jgi:hypothetical protein
MRELAPEVLQLPPEEQAQVRTMARKIQPIPDPEPQSKDEYARTVEGMGRAVKEAANKNFTIIKGTPQTLLLDLDDGVELNQVNYKLMCELLKEWPTMTSWKSKSGAGTHMVLTFEKTTFTVAEALALEASLGSDVKRAMLYVMRLKNEVLEPRVLFKPPYTVVGGLPPELSYPLGEIRA